MAISDMSFLAVLCKINAIEVNVTYELLVLESIASTRNHSLLRNIVMRIQMIIFSKMGKEPSFWESKSYNSVLTVFFLLNYDGIDKRDVIN